MYAQRSLYSALEEYPVVDTPPYSQNESRTADVKLLPPLVRLAKADAEAVVESVIGM
jgi:hypothetical protein